MVYIATEQLVAMEVNFSAAGFMQGISIMADRHTAIQAVHAHVTADSDLTYHRIRLETCANRASVTSTNQYST